MSGQSGGESPPIISSGMAREFDQDIENNDMSMDFKSSNQDNNNYTDNKKTGDEKKTIDKKREQIFYSENSNGPFIVFVESGTTQEVNIGKYSYMKLAKTIFDMKLNNIIRIRNKGNHKIGVEFDNYLSANAFISNKVLLDKGLNSYIPFNMVTCKGIVRRVDPELDIKEIKYLISSKFKILDIKRLNRKVIDENGVQYKPTGTLLITFEGTILPKYLNISYISFPVLPFVPRVTQCFKCQYFGHTENQCKGKKKCVSCSEAHSEEQEYKECKKVLCFHCKSISHKSNNKDCPEYKRQKNIKEKMAFDNVSFYDASLYFPKPDYNSINGDGVVRFRGEDFPSMKKNSQVQNSENITVKDRSQVHFSNIIKTKRSFATASRENKNTKKRIVQNTKDNKDEYNEIWVNPNGRIPQTCPSGLGLGSSHRDLYRAGGSGISTIDNPGKSNQNMFSKNNLPRSASDKSIDNFYKYFLELNNNDKTKFKDIILTYFRLAEVEDFDNLSDTF